MLQQALTIGPVSVGLYASSKFQFYSSGTFVDKRCNQMADHAVLLVGYGVDQMNQDYYILKNSWGTSWGLFIDKFYLDICFRSLKLDYLKETKAI
jgi:C1A family cysteine protease